MTKLIAFGFVVFLVQFNLAHAGEPCQPREQLLENPYVEDINSCIFFLTRTLKETKQRAFAAQLIKRALSDTKHGNDLGPGMPLDYVKLAELAALLNTKDVIDAFLTFIARPADDEVRSFAIGRLYELRTPLVLDRLALLPNNNQKTIIDSIAWGLANNFYLFMNLDNYRRLAVGANWEVLDSKYSHRALVERVEKSLKLVLLEPRS